MDYSLIKKKILELYPCRNENQSMVSFCHDMKIKTSRLRRIFENKDCFNIREQYWGCKLLKINEYEKDDYFSKVVEIIEK